MKLLKQLGILLVFIILVTAVLSLVLPTHQKIERTVTIAAPASVIYEKLVKLEDFNKITVWSQRDSLARYTLNGTDGTLGASYSWIGDPAISGKGKMEITTLEPGKKIGHAFEFTHPKKGKANSIFTLNEKDGSTTVTWTFEMATPRPWNIFNLFYSMDKEMGSDFDEGLTQLKKHFDRSGPDVSTKPSIQVKLINFRATTYATIRQQVKWEDMASFYSVHWQRLLDPKAFDTSIVARTALIYERDEKLRQADIAAALGIPAGTKFEDPIISVIDIPASKGVYVDHMGNTSDVYPEIRKYISDNELKQVGPIIEQYLPGGNTRIIFLVE